MDDVLGCGGLDEGYSVELSKESDEPVEVCFGAWAQEDGACLLGCEGVQESGDENPGSASTLGGVEKLAQEALELLDWNSVHGKQFDAESRASSTSLGR